MKKIYLYYLKQYTLLKKLYVEVNTYMWGVGTSGPTLLSSKGFRLILFHALL